jgi:hypothetical protein
VQVGDIAAVWIFDGAHEIFDQIQRRLGGSKRPRSGRLHAFMASSPAA